MKTHVTLFFLIAAVALPAGAQTPAEPDYGDIISNIQLPLDNYQPLLNEVEVQAVHHEGVDLSTVSFRSLTFPARETDCNLSVEESQEQGKPCPLKENGKLMLCNMEIAHHPQEVSDVIAFELSCKLAAGEASLERVRTRRGASRSSRGRSRGNSRGGSRGGRAGGGSSIAGNSRKDNGSRHA